MTSRPYVLSEASLNDVRANAFDVAVLPWGATEAHNHHLPYGTDNHQCEAIAIEAARLAWARNTRVTVLPTIPIGANAQQLDIPLTLNLKPSNQLALLSDVAASLDAHRVQRLVILNGHGGNDFRWMIRELQPEFDLFMCTVDWFRFIASEEFFDEPGDHAGEMETSLMLHVAPHLVRPLSEAGPGRARKFKVKDLREGRAWAPRQWTKVTDDTGVGSPAAADAEKGERYFRELTARLADFLTQLAAADPKDLYD